jgi:hypothetical protein
MADYFRSPCCLRGENQVRKGKAIQRPGGGRKHADRADVVHGRCRRRRFVRCCHGARSSHWRDTGHRHRGNVLSRSPAPRAPGFDRRTHCFVASRALRPAGASSSFSHSHSQMTPTTRASRLRSDNEFVTYQLRQAANRIPIETSPGQASIQAPPSSSTDVYRLGSCERMIGGRQDDRLRCANPP